MTGTAKKIASLQRRAAAGLALGRRTSFCVSSYNVHRASPSGAARPRSVELYMVARVELHMVARVELLAACSGAPARDAWRLEWHRASSGNSAWKNGGWE